MIDILDVILARALTPQGQIETYAKMAQQAVSKATTAETAMDAAVDAAAIAVATIENTASNINKYAAAVMNITWAPSSTITLLEGGVHTATGNDIAYSGSEKNHYYRTGYIAYDNPLLFELDSSAYAYNIWTYTTNSTSGAYEHITGGDEYVTDDMTIIPHGNGEQYFRIAFRSTDQTHALTSEDLATILSSISFKQVGIDDEIGKLALALTSVNGTGYTQKNLQVAYPDNDVITLSNIIKYYTSTGSNTDGTMTQAAITSALNNLETTLKAYADTHGGGGSSGSTNLGQENAGQVVVVGDDGNITAGDAAEADIIEALIKLGVYELQNSTQIISDFTNKSFVHASSSNDLDSYDMYGGRMRCNVSDNGTINAFYGESSYRDDGSNGQVMVYQPKFYYKRTIIESSPISPLGNAVNKESLIISPTPQAGFKLHPLFINEAGEEVDYVLLSAYEGSIYKSAAGVYDTNDSGSVDFSVDKLSSIAGVKPCSGNKCLLTTTNAEQLAKNRGSGWHITNMAYESAMQMLQVVEFGSFNGQDSLEKGISDIQDSVSYNCASLTGSTASLGNASGHATSTTNEINGITNDYNIEGKRAISYRGVENPWGNMWRMIGGVNIYGDGSSRGGVPYICKTFNYNVNNIAGYDSVGYTLPNSPTWISNFGYNNEEYDWVYMPIATNSSANSALPVGDDLWVTDNLQGYNIAAAGGKWSYGMQNGPFLYACDQVSTIHARSYGVRIMFIPSKNSIYNSNKNKWSARRG